MGTDIITDILSRLHVNSLVRFKRVSKSWNKLISQPYFKRKHLNRAQNQTNSHKLLFGRRVVRSCYFYSSSLSSSSRQIVKDVHKLDYPPNYVPGYCKIYCCCDGLFLIGINYRPKESVFLLWNPSTRESTQLPHPNNTTHDSIYGLGYDLTSDDYKVFKLESHGVDGKVPSEILALKCGSWRNIYGSRDGNFTCFSTNDSMDCLAFVHGAFHWPVAVPRVRSVCSVISFNISCEIYGEVPLSEQIWRPCIMTRCITVLGGMLCISCVYGDQSPSVDLWVMKEYGVKESWTKLFTMDMGGTNFFSLLPIIPKYVYADGEVLLSCRRKTIFMTSKGSVGLSNLIRHLVSGDTDNDTINLGDRDTFGMGGYVYTESLISPEVNH